MSILLPVVAGMAVGIGFIATFAMLFNQTPSPTTTDEPNLTELYQTNLAKIKTSVSADCIDPKCAAEIIINCDTEKTAIVPSDNNRIWIVEAQKNQYNCMIDLEDHDVLLLDGRFADFRLYDCHVPIEELAALRGSSFSMLLSHINGDEGWRCGVAVP